VTPAANHLFEVTAKVVVHERVDDRVCDVVGEVHVEDDDAVRKHLDCHEECRQESDDEDDGHYEQHGCCLQVGYTVLLAHRL